MSLFFIVALPFFGALLPGLMNSAGRSACAGVTFTVSLAAFIGLLTNLPTVLAGDVVMARMDWMPALGLNFHADAGWARVFLCSFDPWHRSVDHRLRAQYLSRDDNMGEFFTYLLLFQGAMVGIVLSDNISAFAGFLGADVAVVFLVDRVLEASARRAPRRAHGVDRHGHGRFGDDWRDADPWADRRQL